jgi:hypothetical protein
MRWPINSVLLTMTVLLASCVSASGVHDRYAERDIEHDELVGNWAPSPGSKSYDEPRPYEMFAIDRQRLILMSNGVCKLVGDRGVMGPSLQGDERCRWHLGKAPTYVAHQRTEKQAVLLRLERGPVNDKEIELLNLFIHEEEGQLFLWDWAGDPDHPNFVTLGKLPDAPR